MLNQVNLISFSSTLREMFLKCKQTVQFHNTIAATHKSNSYILRIYIHQLLKKHINSCITQSRYKQNLNIKKSFNVINVRTRILLSEAARRTASWRHSRRCRRTNRRRSVELCLPNERESIREWVCWSGRIGHSGRRRRRGWTKKRLWRLRPRILQHFLVRGNVHDIALHWLLLLRHDEFLGTPPPSTKTRAKCKSSVPSLCHLIGCRLRFEFRSRIGFVLERLQEIATSMLCASESMRDDWMELEMHKLRTMSETRVLVESVCLGLFCFVLCLGALEVASTNAEDLCRYCIGPRVPLEVTSQA